jgi:hypothetical protein
MKITNEKYRIIKEIRSIANESKLIPAPANIMFRKPSIECAIGLTNFKMPL